MKKRQTATMHSYKALDRTCWRYKPSAEELCFCWKPRTGRAFRLKLFNISCRTLRSEVGLSKSALRRHCTSRVWTHCLQVEIDDPRWRSFQHTTLLQKVILELTWLYVTVAVCWVYVDDMFWQNSRIMSKASSLAATIFLNCNAFSCALPAVQVAGNYPNRYRYVLVTESVKIPRSSVA